MSDSAFIAMCLLGSYEHPSHYIPQNVLIVGDCATKQTNLTDSLAETQLIILLKHNTHPLRRFDSVHQYVCSQFFFRQRSYLFYNFLTIDIVASSLSIWLQDIILRVLLDEL